jgi:hypothetical protein
MGVSQGQPRMAGGSDHLAKRIVDPRPQRRGRQVRLDL